MKKNYLFAATLVAAALAGCSQDELVGYNQESDSNFTATLETVASRTTLDDNYKVQWVVNDDHVSLFEKVDVNAKYQVSAVNDGTATLTYVSHNEKEGYQSLDQYYAVYPYSDNNSIAKVNEIMTITAPVEATYTFKDKESSIASALMVARAETKKMSFTNAQGIIRLKLNAKTPYTLGKIKSVTFTSASNYLNGTATMTWSTDKPSAVISEGNDENKSLTIELDASLIKDLPSKQSGEYAEYYVPVVPTAFGENDLTMAVTFEGQDEPYKKTIPSTFTIERKEIVTLKHTIGSDDFTADIEDEVISDEVTNGVQLAKALAAGGTVTLAADITLTEAVTVPEGVEATLNLNGKTITGQVNVADGADLTVENGTIKNNDDAVSGITSNGNLILDNVQVESARHALRIESGTVVINGGTYKVAPTSSKTLHALNVGDDNTVATVTVKGGTFIGPKGTTADSGSAVAVKAGSTVTIEGGNFSGGKNSTLSSKGTLTVTGGTFDQDPSGYVGTGYSVLENSDNTYTVLEGDVVVTDSEGLKTAIDNGQTNIALVAGDYTLPNVTGKDITLVGVGTETIVDYSHMGGYQEVSGSSFIFKNMTVKNVEAGYPYKGLQHTTSVSYENCHILGTVNLFAPATFTNCTFDSKNAEHNVVTYGSNKVTFTDCKFTYGDRSVNCYAENASARDVKVTFTNCEFTKVAGKETTGAIETNSSLMNSLTVTINNCTVNDGKLWFVAGWDSQSGANTTVTVNGVSSESAIVVQSGVLPYLKLNSNSTYELTGNFSNQNVSLVMPVGVENVVFDGTNATNINELIILQNGTIIDNANDVVGDRSGKVTVQNFNVLSQINVFACKTEAVVQNNTAEALMIHAGNCAVKVLNNTIDANFESHPTYKNATDTWNNNEYGIALNIFEYNLWFEGNTVTDAMSHAVGINGWEGTFDTGKENKIESFTGNNITVNTTSKTKRAAFKVWDDETYASNDDDKNVVNATAQAFINAVLADGSNTFNIAEGSDHTIFCFYEVNTDK